MYQNCVYSNYYLFAVLEPVSDKPVSFVKLFDNKTRTARMQKINEVKENAVNIVA